MAMTVRKSKETRTPKVLMHKVADIRGGVSVKTSELGGDYLPEGAVLTAPDSNGLTHVVKFAATTAAVGASDTSIKVTKYNCFKVDDFVMAETGAKAYAITAIDSSNKDYDTLTIGTAIGAVTKGSFVMEATEESSTTTSALKYEPLAIVGTGKPIIANDNINTDAWVIGVTKGNSLPTAISDKLKGIINY